ncbi:tellurite resistance TerB family protein [Plastorhodobacter daqingensis]|uniref:Tellurite resistance TerB family protein n=1 Tax=Plastorhodobacter daqingensis TaxID=1387281 RepID=A0ABW2UHZ7_9RHOB
MSIGQLVEGFLKQRMGAPQHPATGAATGTGTGAGTTGTAESGRGGLDGLLAALAGGGGTNATPGGGAMSGSPGSAGSLAERARAFLRSEQLGGMSGAQIGGIGAAAGGVLGGGLGGAVRGGAMAVLGTLALRAWREHQGATGGNELAGPSVEQEAVLTGPEAERLVLRAMIGAAQADGHVDEAETKRLLSHLTEGEVSEAERAELEEQLRTPVDLETLGRQVSHPELATEIYLAALLTVAADTDAERSYFRRLGTALRLEPAVVDRLHRMVGAPRL